MTDQRCCLDKYDDLVALALGELDPSTAQALEAHLQTCPACRSVRDALAAEEVQVRSAFMADAHRYEPIERVMLHRVSNLRPEPGPARCRRTGPSLKEFLT